MEYIFCNINWMHYYNGLTEEDQPKAAGLLIKDPSDVFEAHNFRDFNGKCYGYVRTGGDILLDQHFRGVSQGAKELKGVTVVFCAAINEEEARIVGWYEHATAHREMVSLPLYDEEYLYFNFSAEAKDCYLVDPKHRDFVIKRSKSSAPRKGAGKSNLWYAKSDYGRREFIPKVEAYLQGRPEGLIPFQVARILDEEVDPTLSEDLLLDQAMKAYEDGQYKEALRFFHRAHELDPSYDTSLGLAETYYALHAYEKALSVLEALLPAYEEDAAVLELLFMASEVILDTTRAPKYYRALQKVEGTPLSDQEYYDYLNELTDLQRSFGKYL